MLLNYEIYKDFVNKIMKITPIMKTEQLKLMISNNFNQDLTTIDEVLYALKRTNVVVMTVDGWALSLNEYRTLTNNYFFTNSNLIDEEDNVKRAPAIENELKNIDRNIIDALWLIADIIQNVDEFFISASPFTFQVLTKPQEGKKQKLYQICVIRKGEEIVKTEALNYLPSIKSLSSKENVNEIRKSIVRFAVMEDENYAYRIPHKGFSKTVVIDHKQPRHYRVIDERKLEERWQDEA